MSVFENEWTVKGMGVTCTCWTWVKTLICQKKNVLFVNVLCLYPHLCPEVMDHRLSVVSAEALHIWSAPTKHTSVISLECPVKVFTSWKIWAFKLCFWTELTQALLQGRSGEWSNCYNTELDLAHNCWSCNMQFSGWFKHIYCQQPDGQDVMK